MNFLYAIQLSSDLLHASKLWENYTPIRCPFHCSWGGWSNYRCLPGSMPVHVFQSTYVSPVLCQSMDFNLHMSPRFYASPWISIYICLPGTMPVHGFQSTYVSPVLCQSMDFNLHMSPRFYASPWISIYICRALFCVQLFKVKGSCLFCWYQENSWPLLFKLCFQCMRQSSFKGFARLNIEN
jgi:hypothetical protein